MAGDGTLSEREAAVYDRQLRIWGVETQRRLSSAKVLVLGCHGLGAEVAKNLVLAGVGSVMLGDDRPCQPRDPGNFLVPSDAPASQTVAEASCATLCEMNPFVSVTVVEETQDWSDAGSEALWHRVDLVLLLDRGMEEINKAAAACRAAGIRMYAGGTSGAVGWLFADLGEHEFVVERRSADAAGETSSVFTHTTLVYCPWHEAMAADLRARPAKRLHPVYLMLRGLQRMMDEMSAKHVADALAAETGRSVADVVLFGMESMASSTPGMPAVSAVLGGVLANDVVKAVAKKGETLDNMFLFSIADGAGVVDRYQGQLS